MAVEQLTDGRPDGTTFGQSTSDLITFYAGTPIVQPASVGATSTTIGSLTNSSALSLCVSAVMELQTITLGLRTALKNLNLIAGT